MKTKIFISFLLGLNLLSVYAQTVADCPKKGDETVFEKKWQIGINVNTVEPITEAGYDVYFGQTRLFNDFDSQKANLTSFGINVSYKLKDSYGIRLLVKLNNYKVTETYDSRDYVSASPPSSDYIIDTGSVKQTSFVISPGVFWNFTYKKLKLYGGFQIVYKKYNPANEHLIYRFYDSATDSLTFYRYYDFDLKGGYSIGLGPFVGFSIDVFKGISLGAEFSSAYSYYKTGGELTVNETRFYPTALTEGYTNQHSYRAFKFSSIISSLNISYSF